MRWFWLWVIFFVIWIVTWSLHAPGIVVYVFLGLWIAMIFVIFFRVLTHRGLR
ncbi:MAG: hypothetical protein ACRD2F_13840 [Terriglobales bacterium]